MIICMDGTLRMEGNKVEVLAETTLILHGVYETLVKHEGEEKAREQFAEIGRLAVMTDEEISDATNELIKTL